MQSHLFRWRRLRRRSSVAMPLPPPPRFHPGGLNQLFSKYALRHVSTKNALVISLETEGGGIYADVRAGPAHSTLQVWGGEEAA